jgi:hypothetical protein
LAEPESCPKEFHVFHQRQDWISSKFQEHFAATKDPVIAAAHSQNETEVMCQAVGESINKLGTRYGNAKESADYAWIIQGAIDFKQRLTWN